MHRNHNITIILILSILLLIAASDIVAKSKIKSLSPKFKKWLTEDVVWIISKIEQEVFLELQTDRDRDNFIEKFWESRDPSPGTSVNEYKEEHYHRLSYATSHFFGEGAPGWKTDRGRMHIQLGPPAQIFEFTHQYELYPVILWFYSAREHVSLPNHFYLLFWEREGIGGFKLYSPYNDGPRKLVHSVYSDSREQAYKYIHGINSDLARATLTYLPSEPIDPYDLTPSLTSDMMVGKIFNLPSEEAPTSYLTKFLPPDSKLREKVDTRYYFHFQPMKTTFFTATGNDGKTLVHYAFRISPKDLSIVQYKDQYYVSLDITLTVSDENNQMLMKHQQEFVRYFSTQEFNNMKGAALEFKDKVGVVPGKYTFDIIIVNKANSQTYHLDRTLQIPESPTGVPAVSPLVLVKNFEPIAQKTTTPADNLCFSFFGYRFNPMLEKVVRPSKKLNVLYQLYYPPDQAIEAPDELLEIEYRFVDRSGSSTAGLINDKVAKGKFNTYGSLLNFKQLPIEELQNGQHTLVVTVKEASGQLLASQNIRFSVDKGARRTPEQLYASLTLEDDASGLYDYQRGEMLNYLGEKEQALAYFKNAVRKSPMLTAANVSLARLELDRGLAKEASALLKTVVEYADFPANGYLLLARAYVETGHPKDAEFALTTFLEKAGPSNSDYRLIATLYDRIGNKEKAEKIRQLISPETGDK